MKSSHYCIEGCRHDDQCDCDCPSCENHRRQYNQYLIHKKIDDKRIEDEKRMQSFVDNIIKTKTKGFEIHHPASEKTSAGESYSVSFLK